MSKVTLQSQLNEERNSLLRLEQHTAKIVEADPELKKHRDSIAKTQEQINALKTKLKNQLKAFETAREQDPNCQAIEMRIQMRKKAIEFTEEKLGDDALPYTELDMSAENSGVGLEAVGA